LAEIVLGVGTSHSPMLSIPGELWNEYGAEDHERADLAYPPDGRVLTYDEGVRHVDASIRAKVGTTAEFVAQFARCREALGALADEFTRAKPDVVVIVSDDQEEWFFDSLMPMFAVFCVF